MDVPWLRTRVALAGISTGPLRPHSRRAAAAAVAAAAAAAASASEPPPPPPPPAAAGGAGGCGGGGGEGAANTTSIIALSLPFPPATGGDLKRLVRCHSQRQQQMQRRLPSGMAMAAKRTKERREFRRRGPGGRGVEVALRVDEEEEEEEALVAGAKQVVMGGGGRIGGACNRDACSQPIRQARMFLFSLSPTRHHVCPPPSSWPVAAADPLARPSCFSAGARR